MKFVYVLVSDKTDWIIEQAIFSMHSLRMYHTFANITAVMDQATYSGLKKGRERIKHYIDEIITPKIPDNLNQIQKSRFLKTSLRELVVGNFLYIDNDTIIMGPLNETDICVSDVGAVFNHHRDKWNVSQHTMAKDYKNITGKEIENIGDIKHLYNGGVIYAKDTEKANIFFRKWHELWLYDSQYLNFHKDQPSMWRANLFCGNIITPIDGIYNCQLAYPKDCLRYFFNGKIMHYFSSNDCANHINFKHKKTLNYIREHGVDSVIENYIHNFSKDYINGWNFHSDIDYDQPLIIVAIKLSKIAPFINYLLKHIISFYLKLFKKE